MVQNNGYGLFWIRQVTRSTRRSMALNIAVKQFRINKIQFIPSVTNNQADLSKLIKRGSKFILVYFPEVLILDQ